MRATFLKRLQLIQEIGFHGSPAACAGAYYSTIAATLQYVLLFSMFLKSALIKKFVSREILAMRIRLSLKKFRWPAAALCFAIPALGGSKI
jgi:hypothetical protein